MPIEKIKKHIVWVTLVIMVLFGCSVKKNTRSSRAYHELTTRYNILFNAQQVYEETLKSIYESYVDDWHVLLPMYPNSYSIIDSTKKALGGPFDVVVEKTTKAIQEHSISAKPIRDKSKMDSQDYRDWLKQDEFNPFVDQAWLLMAKAHIQNRDYYEAISVLSNIIRLFKYDLDVVSEAQVWLMRAYSEIGWYYDAELVLDALLARGVPAFLEVDFNNSYAFFLLKSGSVSEAIIFLKKVAESETNNIQRRRLWYLIGQLYSSNGNTQEAFDAFEQLKKIDTPAVVALSAIVAQSKLDIHKDNVIKDLLRQAKMSRNESYLDQIYGAIGDSYLFSKDTINAFENYLIAESRSVSKGTELAYVQERLGSLFFNKKRYLEASKRYSKAIVGISQNTTNYNEIVFRAEVLAQLEPFLRSLEEQDSLLYLSSLPDAEKIRIIETHIKSIRNADKDCEGIKLANKQEVPGENNLSITPSSIGLGAGTFYFYNPQLVEQGKKEFENYWGNRKLEDNWRIQDKSSIVFGDFPEQNEMLNQYKLSEVDQDKYSIDYYLRQIPSSDAQIAEANQIIINNLIAIGDIARGKLHDYELAIDSYHKAVDKYGDNLAVVDVLYRLHLVYRQVGNVDKSDNYKNKLLTDFPENKYAEMLNDPEYEDVLSNYGTLEASLYQDTFEEFKNGNVLKIRQNYEKSNRLFGNGTLIVKFKLLNALSYALANDADGLRIELEELISQFAKGPESDLAKDIILRLDEGMALADNASGQISFDFIDNSNDRHRLTDIDAGRFVSNSEEADSVKYSFIILFDEDKQKKSDLLFAISNHNFTSYQLRVFNVNMTKIGNTNVLIISYFSSYKEAMLYSNNVRTDSVFINSLSDRVKTLVMSDTNYNLIITESDLSKLIEIDTISVKTIEPLFDVDRQRDVINEDVEKITIEESVIIENYSGKLSPDDEVETLSVEQQLYNFEQRQQEALSRFDNANSEKEKKRLIKEREKEREELIKQRRNELKIREKARREELKIRERERKQKIREQDEIRRAKLNERNRLLRQ